MFVAGVSTWPGANFVVHPNGDKSFLKFGDRRKIAADLKVRHCAVAAVVALVLGWP